MLRVRYFVYLLCVVFAVTACSSEPEEVVPDNLDQSVLSFSVDPVSQSVIMSTTSAERLSPQQSSNEPRVLDPSELQLESYTFAFLPGNVLRLEASFTNTTGLTFKQPFTFIPNSRTTNIFSSTEPTVTDTDLGGDGVLSPGETTSALVFEVVHKNEAFSYYVQARATVSDPSPNAAFTVNTTDDLTDANPGDGACEAENGLCSLRAAIEESNALEGPDTVKLPAGTYELTLTYLTISDDLVLEGAGQGNTVIEENLGNIDPNRNDPPIFLVTATTVMRNLTYQGATSDGAPISNTGTLTLEDVEVANFNTSYESSLGGSPGIINRGSLTLLRTKLVRVGNSYYRSSAYAAFNAEDATLIVRDSEISNGDVDNEDAGNSRSGGILNAGTLQVEDSLISRNDAFTSFGGISNSGEAVILRTVISKNTNARAYVAGGIGNSGVLRLEDSIVRGNRGSNNYGQSSGGGITNSGTMVILRSTVSGNWASARDYSSSAGGGIYNTSAGNLILENSTVSQNRTGENPYSNGLGGAGLYNFGDATITNSTFSENESYNGFEIVGNDQVIKPYEGGSIYNEGTVELSNSIFANSVALSECAGSGEFISQGNNLADDDSCGLNQASDFADTDPLLGPLQDNSGPTPTHALLTGSPAIDAGSTDLATDQRGVARPQGAGSDIGAFEQD